MSVRRILGALATVALCTIAGCVPDPSTKLVIDITGGFAYVPTRSKNMLEIAYLNTVDTPGCHVEQIGTQLIVVRGTVVAANPAMPEDFTFDLNGWDVTFPDLDKANLKMKGWRKKGMPRPKLPGHAHPWDKSEYVPATKDHHDKSMIKANWQKDVNGEMILKGGHITGSTPSDPLMQDAKFSFEIGSQQLAEAAVTDKMVYTVNVPGEQVEMVLTKRDGSATKRVVLKAPAAGKPVRLTLRGLHDMPMTGAYGKIELKDFCAFYSLLTDKDGMPIPRNKQLKIFYQGPTNQASTTPSNTGITPTSYAAQPSPGFYCNGDWF